MNYDPKPRPVLFAEVDHRGLSFSPSDFTLGGSKILLLGLFIPSPQPDGLRNLFRPIFYGSYLDEKQ